MPRPPKFIHPLRRVREILEISQDELAKRVGISRSALQQIERGMLPLSEEIHERILLITGANLPMGLCRTDAEPLAWNGHPYSKSLHVKWVEEMFPQETDKLRKMAKLIADDVERLLKIAEGSGNFYPFAFKLQSALGQMAESFRFVEELRIDDDIHNQALDRLFGNFPARAIANGLSDKQINLHIEMQNGTVASKAAGSSKKQP